MVIERKIGDIKMFVVTIEKDPVRGFETWFDAQVFRAEQQKSGANLVNIFEIEYQKDSNQSKTIPFDLPENFKWTPDIEDKINKIIKEQNQS